MANLQHCVYSSATTGQSASAGFFYSSGSNARLKVRGTGTMTNRREILRISCAATGRRSTSSDSSKSALDPSQAFLGHDYFKILGVTVDTPPGEIRKAYWKLQKKHHPDVAGEEGHEMALLLNEAYNTLMNDHRRAAYEGQWRSAAAMGYAGYTGEPRSKWNGPDWPQGVFVDETACVGCQECKFMAPKTFTIDPESNKARVKVQWGDSEVKIKAATESCPVNCIHAVPKDDLAVLEFLMQPREKESHGVWGGGWEMPERGNIFVAAQNFKRRLQKQQEEASRKRQSSASQESPAQRAARQQADLQTRGNPFWWLWTWGPSAQSHATPQDSPSQEAGARRGRGSEESKFPWQHMFGRSSTSELLKYSVAATDVEKVVTFVQEWASLWASSSELPLPLPFRTDHLPEGVQLTLLSIGSGTLTPMGSLLITVNPISAVGFDDGSISAVDLAALGGPLGAEEGRESGGSRDDESGKGSWVLSVKRHGVTGDKALPGEGRIVGHLKDALARRDNARGYEAYHLPRRS